MGSKKTQLLECQNPDCNKNLGKFIAKNTIEVFGNYGLYEIEYLRIKIECGKCGHVNYLDNNEHIPKEESLFRIELDDKLELSERENPTSVIPIRKKFFKLSKIQGENLQKNLTEPQSKLYKLLKESDLGAYSCKDKEEKFRQFVKKLGTTKQKVKEDYIKIKEEIEKIVIPK